MVPELFLPFGFGQFFARPFVQEGQHPLTGQRAPPISSGT